MQKILPASGGRSQQYIFFLSFSRLAMPWMLLAGEVRRVLVVDRYQIPLEYLPCHTHSRGRGWTFDETSIQYGSVIHLLLYSPGTFSGQPRNTKTETESHGCDENTVWRRKSQDLVCQGVSTRECFHWPTHSSQHGSFRTSRTNGSGSSSFVGWKRH